MHACDRQTDRRTDRITTPKTALAYARAVKNYRLENVAINDIFVLPLKASRCNAIANLKFFGASDTRDLISMAAFTFTMRYHLIRLASVPVISSLA